MEDNTLNFNSISPSAMKLLETRSYTSIPFAKESYQIISQFKFTETKEKMQLTDESFKIAQVNSSESQNELQLPKEIILRIMHFEARYLSIDQGLQDLGLTNILEIGSGFSNRGLDFCRNSTVRYIDTDLAELVEAKKSLVDELIKSYCNYQPNNLLLTSLNALNKDEFFQVVSNFNNGPISIVNEGLLMYLDTKQKEQLSNIIHNVLSNFGGYWITADIYQKGEVAGRKYYKQKDMEFVKKHNIDKNRFESFTAAEDLFSRCGFEIYKKIEVENSSLTSSVFLNEQYPETQSMPPKEKTRETWILKPI